MEGRRIRQKEARPPRRGRLGMIAAAALVCAAAGILLWKLGRLGQSPSAFVIPEHIVVCLDAGHGDTDAGAVFGDRLEKDDNLRMALAVQERLEAFGSERVSVVLTREDDTFLELQARADLANSVGATVFVSLHRNSGGGQGVEVWTSAQAEKWECRLAQAIMDELEQVGVSRVRGVRHGTAGNPAVSYAVVSRTEMPACLVELGFIDSETDNRLLDEHFDDYAQAIADGILRLVKLK